MFRSMTLRSTALALGLLSLSSLPALADAIFNFESVASGTALPLTLTNNGLSATFTGSADVCASGGIFNTLSGNVLIQSLCHTQQSGNLAVSFSQTLSSLSFDFANALAATGTLHVNLFENGVAAGSSTFTATIPPGRAPNPEGFATLTGSFNSITLSSTDILALDNFDAVPASTAIPEPSTIIDCLSGTAILAGFSAVPGSSTAALKRAVRQAHLATVHRRRGGLIGRRRMAQVSSQPTTPGALSSAQSYRAYRSSPEGVEEAGDADVVFSQGKRP